MSGISDSILITGRALVRRGHEVMVVGPRYIPADYEVVGRPVPRAGEEIVDGMRFMRLPAPKLPHSPTGQSHVAIPSGASLRAMEAFKPDVIHTHGPYGVGLEALRASKRLRVPLVGTNHTPIEEYYPVGKSLMRSYDAWYYNHCDFMTTPYAELIDHMRGAGFHKPARELPNPVELSMFRAPHADEKTAIKQELGFRGPVVMYCGNFYAGKHVDVTMRAIAELIPTFPTLIFVVVGRGEEEGNLHTLANRLGIEEHVRFTGFVQMEHLMPYYQAADVFAIMSTVDTQSIALMQAFASGTPAVGARARGLPDFLPEHCGFLVEPGDVKACAESIHTLLLDTNLAERMSREAVLFVKQFSPDVIAHRWEEVYEHAIGNYRK
ncbi:MAG TPA: glycosyltransferase [Candidatus Paceibacterota bacterium]